MPPAVAEARTLPPLPPRALSPRLQALRARAMGQAQALRGLDWKGEVGMAELTGAEYATRTREMAEVLVTEDLQALSRLAVAGGVLPEGTDLATLAASFTAATAGATYSPLDKQVLLRSDGTKNGSFSDHSLLVHELVHALQDQHFDLLPMLVARPYDFDRTEAAFALVEGDAMSVQRRLEGGDAWTRRSVEQIAQAEDARFDLYRRTIGAFFHPLLVETFVFRYRDGLRFVETLRRARPAVNLNELFRRPPASSEQVLHPEKYFAGEAPREASVDERLFAAEGWRAGGSTALGEIGVRGLLLAGMPVAEARRAAAGWGGDRAYVFEREGRHALFVWKTVWDAPTDAQEFFRAYDKLGRVRGAETAQASLPTGGEAQALWREGAAYTFARLDGDGVLILRGSEADIAGALQLAAR
jgi:hypothetical protein